MSPGTPAFESGATADNRVLSQWKGCAPGAPFQFAGRRRALSTKPPNEPEVEVGWWSADLARCITRKQLEYTRAHHTKYDYRIPMRDGIKLFTSVYVPKDDSKKYPILMQRTPYSIAPYGINNYPTRLGPSDLFTKEGLSHGSRILCPRGARS
jgi:predicted acyl esterase